MIKVHITANLRGKIAYWRIYCYCSTGCSCTCRVEREPVKRCVLPSWITTHGLQQILLHVGVCQTQNLSTALWQKTFRKWWDMSNVHYRFCIYSLMMLLGHSFVSHFNTLHLLRLIDIHNYAEMRLPKQTIDVMPQKWPRHWSIVTQALAKPSLGPVQLLSMIYCK